METLAHAEQIRDDADGRYPALAVTEASTTNVVDSLVLLGGPHGPPHFALVPISDTRESLVLAPF